MSKNIAWIAIGVIAAYVVWWIVPDYFRGEKGDPRSQEYLSRIAAELNRAGPLMIDKETDARFIGYGAMAMESLVGVVALIAAIHAARGRGRCADRWPHRPIAARFDSYRRILVEESRTARFHQTPWLDDFSLSAIPAGASAPSG